MNKKIVKNLVVTTTFVGTFLLTRAVIKKVKEYKELSSDEAIKEKVSNYLSDNFPEQGKIYDFYNTKEERKYTRIK